VADFNLLDGKIDERFESEYRELVYSTIDI
jgi:hypothetical protein